MKVGWVYIKTSQNGIIQQNQKDLWTCEIHVGWESSHTVVFPIVPTYVYLWPSMTVRDAIKGSLKNDDPNLDIHDINPRSIWDVPSSPLVFWYSWDYVLPRTIYIYIYTWNIILYYIISYHIISYCNILYCNIYNCMCIYIYIHIHVHAFLPGS